MWVTVKKQRLSIYHLERPNSTRSDLAALWTPPNYAVLTPLKCICAFQGWFLLFPCRTIQTNNIWSVPSHVCMSFVGRKTPQPLPSPMSFTAEQTLYGVAQPAHPVDFLVAIDFFPSLETPMSLFTESINKR